MLASCLDHGHPLKVSPSLLEIGFLAEDSYQLKSLKEPDTSSELQALAKGFFRAETDIRFVPLQSAVPAPPSLLEKKSLEDADRQQRIKELATSHPMVAVALDIFGGEIGEVREAEKREEV